MSEEQTLSEAIKILRDFLRSNDTEDQPLPCERYSLAQVQQAIATRDALIEQLGDALALLLLENGTFGVKPDELTPGEKKALTAFHKWNEGEHEHKG